MYSKANNKARKSMKVIKVNLYKDYYIIKQKYIKTRGVIIYICYTRNYANKMYSKAKSKAMSILNIIKSNNM